MKHLRRFYALAVLAAVSPVAFSQTTYDPITTAVDWAEVVTGVVAIAALIAAVLVVVRGSRMLLGMVRR